LFSLTLGLRVSRYKKPRLPIWLIERLFDPYSWVKNVGERILVNAPDVLTDYPDNPIPDNIEKTINHVVDVIYSYRSVKWLIPI